MDAVVRTPRTKDSRYTTFRWTTTLWEVDRARQVWIRHYQFQFTFDILYSTEPLPLSGYDNDGKPVAFPPHSSLTAVDNGSQLHLIYKSHSGKVKVIRIDPNQGLQVPELFFHDLAVAPRSYIAACLAPNTGITTSIVLFYQVLDDVSRKFQMTARVVSRPTTATSGTKWNVSNKENLGE